MKLEIYPSVLRGSVLAPGSKSIAQRMIACALLAKGESVLHDFPENDDCSAAVKVAQALGAVVTKSGTTLTIQGGFPHNQDSGIRYSKDEIHCGESGLASRMFAPIASLADWAITILGEKSLLTRPFSEFEHVLPQLGVHVSSKNGKLPMVVKGPLRAGSVVMDGSVSSQFVTGVLLALSCTEGNSQVEVTDAKSTPYIDLTLEVAAKFGASIEHEGYKHFKVAGKKQLTPQELRVAGDWSGASFLLVAAALCAEEGIEVEGLSEEFTQADKKLLQALESAGVEMRRKKNAIWIKKSTIQAFEFDATDCPDLFPPLAAMAAFANGVCIIAGASRLVHKESNRAKVLTEEMGKANVRIVCRGDEMKIYPGHIRQATINAHGDHRIAMAGALLGLGGDKITIMGAECVAKSYPNFYRDLKSLGAKIGGGLV
jgi:3-phosphoshikimate 1-carboxyvinyltransferase